MNLPQNHLSQDSKDDCPNNSPVRGHLAIRVGMLVAATTFALCQPASAQTLDLPDEFTLADIARYNNLPMRYFLRPEFQQLQLEWYFDDRFRDTFVKVLHDDLPNELHEKAARSLERVATEKLSDPATFVAALRHRLTTTTSREVRRACAAALVAADSREDAALLADWCRPDDEVLCSRIESWLAENQSDVLKSDWIKRISAPRNFSRTMLMLACHGLADLNAVDTVPQLKALVSSEEVGFKVRMAAAEAVATLSTAESFELAERLATGVLTDKLLAVQLLATAETDASLKILESLCDDRENSVAARAWNALLRQDGNRLLSRLAPARTHRDPNVRFVVILACEQFPEEDRCNLLNQMLADSHIGVRNKARQSLHNLAEKESSLKDLIQQNAGTTLSNPDATWEHLEQSMLLLGSIRHFAFQNDCVPLLQSDRPEVFVTAAWLLHLHPEMAWGKAATAEAVRKWSAVQAGDLVPEVVLNYSIQIAYLCQVAAGTEAKEIMGLCRDMFSKTVPLQHETRSVAMWTLGTLMVDTQDEQLRKSFTERVFDDSPLAPEEFVVRAGAALSLGLLGDPAAIPDLKKAHMQYGPVGKVGLTSITALRRLGQDIDLPDPPPKASIQNWPISFVE